MPNTYIFVACVFFPSLADLNTWEANLWSTGYMVIMELEQEKLPYFAVYNFIHVFGPNLQEKNLLF